MVCTVLVYSIHLVVQAYNAVDAEIPYGWIWIQIQIRESTSVHLYYTVGQNSRIDGWTTVRTDKPYGWYISYS